MTYPSLLIGRVTNRTYKDMYTIISEIGKVWKDLEDVDRAAVLEALAGKKQSNTLAAVLNNYERLEDIYKTAENSAGSAMEEQRRYTESLQYSIDQLTAHVEEFWKTFINKDEVKDFIDLLNDLIGMATGLVDTFGALPTTVGIFALFKGFQNKGILRTFESDVDKLSAKIGIFGKSFDEFFEAGRNRKLDIDNMVQYEGKTLKEAKKDVDSFWSYLDGKKSSKKNWIKNDAGDIVDNSNIDSYIPEIDIGRGEEIAKVLRETDALVKEGKVSWGDYYTALDSGSTKYIPDLVQGMGDVSTVTGEKVVEANAKARASAVSFNAGLKQMTLGAKAAKVALQTLTSIGSMIAITLIMEGISKLMNAEEEALNKASEAYENAQKDIDELQERENIALSTSKELSELLSSEDWGAESAKKASEIYNDMADKLEEVGGAEEARIKQLREEANQIRNNINLSREEREAMAAEERKNLLSDWGQVSSVNTATSGLDTAEKKFGKVVEKEFAYTFTLSTSAGAHSNGDGEITMNYAKALEGDVLSPMLKPKEDSDQKNKVAQKIIDTMKPYLSTELTGLEYVIVQGANSDEIYENAKDFIEAFRKVNDIDDAADTELYSSLKVVYDSINDSYKEIEKEEKAVVIAKAKKDAYEYFEENGFVIDDLDSEKNFIDYLKDENYSDSVIDEVRKAVEDSGIYSDKYYNEVGNTIESLEDGTIAVEGLAKASGKLSKVGKALEDLGDSGRVSFDSIIALKEAFGDSVENWAEYESILLSAKSGSEDLNKVIDDLTYSALENQFALNGLENATREQITLILKEAKVANADALAMEYLARAKIRNSSIFKDVTDGYKNLDAITALGQEGLFAEQVGEGIQLLMEYGEGIGLTEGQVVNLIATEIAFNNTELSVEQQVRALNDLANAYLGVDLAASSVNDKSSFAEKKAYAESVGIKVHDGEGYWEKGGTTFYGAAYEYGGVLYDKIDEANRAYLYDTIKNGTKDWEFTAPDFEHTGTYSNEALDNYLEVAEKSYKIHQDEARYIQDLMYASENLTKKEEERLDIAEKINEAYINLAENRIGDIEHQIDLKKKLHGEDVDVSAEYDEIQKIAHEEADRLRSVGYDDNSDEVQNMQKIWWDAQNNKLDFYTKQHENVIRDIEHARDMALEQNPYIDTTSYYKQMQDEYHKEAERLRALDPEKYKEEIQKLQLAWWNAQESIVDWRWDNSNNWIDERNTYNDWALFDDSEVDAWERVVKWLKEEYPNDLKKIKEAEESLFNARKKEFNNATNFGNTYLGAQKTLLESYHNVTNSIAEAQHEINKELETSKTMYEYLDEDTRKLLFNQDDYNELSEELLDIQYRADKLQRQYKRDLENSTLETVESITSNYQMQYETLMKSYEIAKADLEIAKKKAKLNNVLNERNVRMFINGSWQWVANTEDVANAKSELADAEYAKRVEESGLTQQQSINNLTKQQDELGVVIKQFENGVIDLDEAIRLAEQAIGTLPGALASIFDNAKTPTSSGTGSYGVSGGVGYDKNANYMDKIRNSTNEMDVIEYNNARNAKIAGEGLASDTIKIMTDVEALEEWKKAKGHATGTRFTPGGLTKMGEDGEELFISANGRLIPIAQPTIGNVASGGVVFNAEQMKNLRTMWDMSNLKFTGGNLVGGIQSQQMSQVYDNSITINGMTVDSGSADGQALISALRRYVGNH